VKQHHACQRRLGVFVCVDLFDCSLVAHPLCGVQARSVQVEPGVEHLLVERMDGLGLFLRDVAVAHALSDDAGVLAVRQRVVIAASRT
jgi:hypothetical protein